MFSYPTSGQFRKALYIVKTLQRKGYRACFAGGCVRDIILANTPRDYDIATNAHPSEVETIFPETRPVGRQFGVILVMVDGVPFEVATFRTESNYSDGRRPENVEYATLAEDARRRDYTINALYWDPVAGQLIDRVGGLADIRDRLIRAVGDPSQRFEEDHLRLIRAVRFAARLNYNVGSTTRKALQKHAHLTTEVAAERLQQELRVILTDRAPACAVRLMDELGMLDEVFPELSATHGCEQPDNYHPEGDVFVHSILTLEKLGPCPDFVVAMAALLHDIGKPPANRGRDDLRFPQHERIGAEMIRDIGQRLKLPNRETERIAWLAKRHMYFKDAQKMNDSTLKQLFAEAGFHQLCALVRADSLASWGKLEDLEYVLQKKEEFRDEDIDPPPLVTGHDLIEMGYAPGPAFGVILDHIREKQLNGDITERDEALEAVEHLARTINAPRKG